jgi:hypothetical protein
MVDALDAAYREARLDLKGVAGFAGDGTDDVAWRRLRRRLFRIKWVSYAKPPFAGPESVYQYLGRYTHRVGLSNHRLVSATDDAVTFRTWGDETATLHPHEFLRRFLLHVLPRGFVKLRHYGLLAPGNVNTRLVTARTLLEQRAPAPAAPAEPSSSSPVQVEHWQSLLQRLTGVNVSRCGKCNGVIHSRPLERPRPRDTS